MRETFRGHTLRSPQQNVEIVRIARSVLWPALKVYKTVHSSARGVDLEALGLWTTAVALTPTQAQLVTGVPPSVGGIIYRCDVFDALGRASPGFVNSTVADADLNRNNKLHLLTVLMGLGGQGFNCSYRFNYVSQRYRRSKHVDVPVGNARKRRCDGTNLIGEVLSDWLWTTTLPEVLIEYGNQFAIEAPELMNEAQGLDAALCAKWAQSVDTVFNPAKVAPGLRFGDRRNLRDRARVKFGTVVLPAVPDPAAPLTEEQLEELLVSGSVAGGRLISFGQLGVVASWVARSSSEESAMDAIVFSSETGMNRFISELRRRADETDTDARVVSAIELGATEEREELALPQNAAPATSPGERSALTALVDELLAIFGTRGTSIAAAPPVVDSPDAGETEDGGGDVGGAARE